MPKRQITRADIMPMTDYEAVRDERRRAVQAIKRLRRVSVGPDVTLYFENFETMLHQVHEMLRIEKGGEAQIEDELRAYNPLVPDGSQLVATMMVEIDEPVRRARILAELGGIERTVSLNFAGISVAGVPEADIERTTETGKTSSVHFLKFSFSSEQIALFRQPGTRVILSISHPAYDHMAAVPEPVRAALAEDFA
jgi:hypothetical protein